MSGIGEAGRWMVRFLLAAVAATSTWVGVLAAVDGVTTKSPPVQTEALRALNTGFAMASAQPPAALNVVFFGDSLSMPENVLSNSLQSTPGRLLTRLGDTLSAAKLGDQQSIKFVRIWYSGLSQWSLYYLSSSMVAQSPDIAVLEFNLYNFSAAWRHHDRTILSAFLPVRRFPQAVSLPLAAAGFATDEWLFHRYLLLKEWEPLWESVQHEQARCAEAYWILSSQAGRIVTDPLVTLRDLNRLLDLRRRTIISKEPGGNRSTEMYARRMLGNALTGVDESDDAIRMYEAALEVFAARGVKIFTYIPPYNLEHLRSLGVLEGSRFTETIDLVRRVTERHGAHFVDLHDLLTDRYFRDDMDHLKEGADPNGHDLVAARLTDAVADEAKRLVAGRR